MARFPRTLGDALAAQAEAARNARTSVMGVDALSPIGLDQLETDLADNIVTIDSDLNTLKGDMALVDSKISDAISDSNAMPITSDRFTEDSLSIWPFIQGTVPQGALAPGAVGSDDIADFSLVVRKFKDDRHRLY